MRTNILLFFTITFFAFSACNKSDNGDDYVDKGILSISQKELVIEAEGGAVELTVTSDKKVYFVNSKGWISTQYDEEKQTNNLSLIVEENVADRERIAGLLIKTEGGLAIEINIKQKGNNSIPDIEEEGIQVKASSYNIRYAAAADETTGNGWNIRKIPLANLIRNHSLDIVGTQEGNFSQMDNLMTLMPEYAYVGYPYAGSTSRNHTASIVYKRNKYQVLKQGVFWYSETPNLESIGWDATDTRICTWAKMKDKESEQEFYFFSSHFYYQYVTAKRNSGMVMVNKIREINTENLPVISTGDLNSNPNTPQILDVLTLLKDSYDLSETPKSGPMGTGFAGGVFEGTPGGRIDYVLVSNGIRVLSYAVLTDSYNNGRYPSDHLPVVCDLFIKK